MKLTLAVICLFVTVVISEAYVCPKDFCKNVNCSDAPKREECSNGLFVEYGSFCGCCPTCYEYIPIGDTCFVLGGLPLGRICQPTTDCVNNKCQKQKPIE